MLNDPIMRKLNGLDHDEAERRGAARQPIQAEAVISWHFDPNTPVRYAAMDLSETGIRIRSLFPILEGMTGTLRSILPVEGAVDRPIMVVWSRPASDEVGSYDAGLRFF
ncbi:MAG: PilZ domain-containing protein [Phycisphaerales bacterium]|nr:PilZ domain-containing protein [Phycisphaerales bacterium]